MTEIQKLTMLHADYLKWKKKDINNLTKFFTFRVTNREYLRIKRNGGGKWLRGLMK
jgi:hypothetical protein